MVTPNLIIINARVHTMDVTVPLAEAVAVYSNRILAVGPTEEIRRMAGPCTQIVDAGGKVVLPGFNDSHVHCTDDLRLSLTAWRRELCSLSAQTGT
jgi:predicted amidohydrolase YtcJ